MSVNSDKPPETTNKPNLKLPVHSMKLVYQIHEGLTFMQPTTLDCKVRTVTHKKHSSLACSSLGLP